ncbi:Fpg/Nei family DNA glycosylase [Arthrobacter sp. FW305-BF8]|uniref:Fpg/Nei family DNA glycosylase n=1 Tax=Arthrobacter sp. FW305-BF8 TaxID=2879617 RepID=UPI001F2861E9|nr:DNA-formamidopyrimidine glycosylase family protein [Arthrobacter sp. FW305-BF8]UKA52696.1 Fpg/Nei family DNA glycosylase [Arthrobacter sp. FW305-BF8]
MPEGHSIHRLARQFGDVFAGEPLAVSSPQGRFAAGAALLDGHTMVHASAHGKHLFLHFEHALVLHVHLGLYGAWDFGGDSQFRGASSIGAPRRVGEREVADGTGSSTDGPGNDAAPAEYAGPPAPVGAVRVRLVSDHGWADLRGATTCAAITDAEAAAVLDRLGPDPLHNTGGSRDDFIRRVLAKWTPLATLLMDQKVIAGVGNVYRAEVLFRGRIDPLLPGRALTADAAGLLWDDTAAVMADGVRDGRIITTTAGFWTRSGQLPPGEEAHFVYRRHGQPCRVCGTPVALAEHAARKLYWCPSCQQPV